VAIFIGHFPPTIAEEAALLRRGIIRRALTPEQRQAAEQRDLERQQARAVKQAEALLAAAR
jgi:hypothetical protein